MNVLSLFDGMSCGQIALNQLGIKVDKYYASEIDKYAITITKKNFPNTIHLGDVTKVKAEDLEPIDLLMGGSPCQGFSFAGRQLNFNDPRSALFFEFVRLLKECKPKYFLLENVRMKKEYQDVISEHLGVEPIMINSALVSAQNRVRLYWTNIPNIIQPQDKGLMLKDILEYNQSSVSELSNAKKDRILNSKRGKGFFYSPNTHDKIGTLVAGYHKEPTDGSYLEVPKLLKNPERIKERSSYFQFDVSGKGYNSQQDRIRKLDKPSGTLAAQSASIPKILCGRLVNRKINPKTGKRDDNNSNLEYKQKLENRKDNKSGCLTTVQKDNVLVREKSKTVRSGGRGSYDRHEWDSVGNKDTELYYRKLTPTECERLQTVPDGYTEGVSNTQRYRMLGNGWTVEVIKHILGEIR